MTNVSPAQCVRECVKGCSDYDLISDKVYMLKGGSKQFDTFGGQSVTVKGDVSGTIVTVRSIATVK